MLDTLERVFLHIFEGLNARCGLEIEAVRKQFPFADLKFKRPAFRFTFREATKMLREHGPAIGAEQLAALEAQQAKAEAAGREEEVKEALKLITDHKAHLATVATHGDLEDISTRDEKLLGVVMNRVKGIDFYVVDKFPADLRPFYTMPDPTDPTVSNSYDIFIRGEEVTSGAQRIHDSAMLLARAKSMEVRPPRAAPCSPVRPRAAPVPPYRPLFTPLAPLTAGYLPSGRPRAAHRLRQVIPVRRPPARGRRHRARARGDALHEPRQHPQDLDVPARPQPPHALTESPTRPHAARRAVARTPETLGPLLIDVGTDLARKSACNA